MPTCQPPGKYRGFSDPWGIYLGHDPQPVPVPQRRASKSLPRTAPGPMPTVRPEPRGGRDTRLDRNDPYAAYYAEMDARRRGNAVSANADTDSGGGISFFCLLLIAAIVYVTQVPTSPEPSAQFVKPPTSKPAKPAPK